MGRRRAARLPGMIRPATPADVPEIHAMVRELAEYEKALSDAKATEQQLHDALFGEHPAVFAHVAEEGDGGGAVGGDGVGGGRRAGGGAGGGAIVGFALWFRNFSTWNGTHGIYLEDLYVRPHARGAGHGKALLTELARICVERGYGRLEWSVLDWNEPSIAFYRALGAVAMDGWTVHRLDGGALASLGAASA